MRKMLLGFVLVAPTAFAGTKFYGDGNWGRANCVGSEVHINSYRYRLSSTKKCNLPIVNAKHMKAFELDLWTAKSSGCWGKTLSNDAILIYSDGKTESIPLVVLEEVDIDKSGHGTVISISPERSKILNCPT